MGHELGRDIDVDDIHGECAVPDIWKKRKSASDRGEHPVKEEIGRGRAEDELVEDVGHGNECGDNKHHKGYCHPY